VADGLLHVEGDVSATAFPLSAVRLEPRLGGLPRRLDLPGGASCVVPADFELPSPAPPARVDRWVNEMEVRWAPAVAAAVLLLVLLWGGIVYGVPVAANVVARRMSPVVERQMGAQALSTLDRIALEQSALTPERQAQLTTRFAALLQAAAPARSSARGWVDRKPGTLAPCSFSMRARNRTKCARSMPAASITAKPTWSASRSKARE
jgi:hypothetical protein